MRLDTGFHSIGAANLYYELAGEGQPVVFIHAGVADSRQWNNAFADLAQDYLVLRYDMRGYGRSFPAEGEFSHMGDLLALLDHLGLDVKLVLIGCSMGGGLAMDFALEHPARVKGLVMVGSGPTGLKLDVPSHPRQAEAGEAYEQGDLDRVAELEAQIWFDGMERAPDEVDPTMRKLALEMNRLALEHDAKKLGKRMPDTDTPAVDRLNGLNVPVLVLIGEHDLPYLQAAGDFMVEHLSNVRRVVLEDSAHLPNMDQPDRFLGAVRAFLGELEQ